MLRFRQAPLGGPDPTSLPGQGGTGPPAGSRPAGSCARPHESAWLLIVAIVPLAINPWGLQVFDLPKIVLLRSVVVGMAALWLWQQDWRDLLNLRRASRKLWSDPRLWAVIVGLLYSAATVMSVDIKLSVWGTAKHAEGLYTSLTYLALFAIVATRLRSELQARRLLWAIVAGSFPIVVYGLLQWFGIDAIAWDTTGWSRVLSTIGRSNFLGSYLVLSLPLCMGATLLTRRLWLRGILGLDITASLVLLWLARARSASVAIALASILILAWFIVNRIA